MSQIGKNLMEIVGSSETYNVLKEGVNALKKTREYDLDFKSVTRDQPLEASFGAAQAVGAGLVFGAISPLVYAMTNNPDVSEAGLYATGIAVCLGLGAKTLAAAMHTAHIAERRIYTMHP